MPFIISNSERRVKDLLRGATGEGTMKALVLCLLFETRLGEWIATHIERLTGMGMDSPLGASEIDYAVVEPK